MDQLLNPPVSHATEGSHLNKDDPDGIQAPTVMVEVTLTRFRPLTQRSHAATVHGRKGC